MSFLSEPAIVILCHNPFTIIKKNCHPFSNISDYNPRFKKKWLAKARARVEPSARKARQVCTRGGLSRGGGIQTRQINMPSITPARRLLSSRGVSRACAASALVGGSAGVCCFCPVWVAPWACSASALCGWLRGRVFCLCPV